MVFVGARGSGGFRVGFNNSNSNSNSNNNNNTLPRRNDQNNTISYMPLGRNVYRITWQNRARKTHRAFYNPDTVVGLIKMVHPGLQLNPTNLNARLAGIHPSMNILINPFTQQTIKRSQLNKVRNPHYSASPRRSPARASPARASPARRSPARASPARRRTTLNRARSAGHAAGRVGLAAGRVLARAGLAAGRVGLAAGRAAGRMAVNAYRRRGETQRNRNIERARRVTQGGAAMRGLPRINYNTNNAARRRLLGY